VKYITFGELHHRRMLLSTKVYNLTEMKKGSYNMLSKGKVKQPQTSLLVALLFLQCHGMIRVCQNNIITPYLFLFFVILQCEHQRYILMKIIWRIPEKQERLSRNTSSTII